MISFSNWAYSLALALGLRGLKSLKRLWPHLMASTSSISTGKPEPGGEGWGGGGGLLPIHSLNEIQTMFSHFAKRSARVLPVDSCIDRAHYVKVHRSTVLRRNKNIAVEGVTVSYYYILVIRKLLILCRFSDIVCGFLFLLNNFPRQSLEYATYSSVQLTRTAEELSYRAVLCGKR